ncbi:hypothetical protein BT63DRAFT_418404 [Microthyrium microscopicum]|uniref:CFEM domain-containing protein n=1 Tax=Microthyrium microscopicum TaxID=703497 RepID=A0A6A6TY65_9PEZI|nr:hypothetical protein BT63DRAFT_418404 [Microthyrium microscopicum]
MKASFVIFAVLLQLVIVSAEHQCEQVARTIPQCAIDCMDQNALDSVGCKSVDDYECLCDQAGWRIKNAIQGCAISKCGMATASGLSDKATELCDCVKQARKDEL